ncbi:MAG: hypothetical protein ACYTEL_07695 [Planctomycetota bacterium]
MQRTLANVSGGKGRPNRTVTTLQVLLLVVLLALPSYVAWNILTSKSPEQVVQSFFVAKEFPGMGRYLTGEMSERHTDPRNAGGLLPDNAKVTYRLVSEASGVKNFAVRMTYEGESQDLYCYLSRQWGRWKIEAIRALGKTGIVHQLVEQLEHKHDRPEEEEWKYQSGRLIIASDDELKEYFRKNKEKFEEILQIFIRESSVMSVGHTGMIDRQDESAYRDDEAIVSKVRELHLEQVKRKHVGMIDFVIGGMVNDKVGFMYVPNKKDVPEMNPSTYIYIEEVASSWYIYKLT